MALHMKPVVSSNIARLGYDQDAQRLVVHFNSGKVYEYTGVEEGAFVALITAKSHGSAFNSLIKPKGYPFKQIDLKDI